MRSGKSRPTVENTVVYYKHSAYAVIRRVAKLWKKLTVTMYIDTLCPNTYWRIYLRRVTTVIVLGIHCSKYISCIFQGISCSCIFLVQGVLPVTCCNGIGVIQFTVV